MPIEDSNEVNSAFDDAYNGEVVDGGTEEIPTEGLEDAANLYFIWKP